MMQHAVATVPKLNNQNHRKRMTRPVRKAVNPAVTAFPKDRKGRIIFLVMKLTGDKAVNLQRSDTTTHAGNQVTIRKKLTITVMPANKLLYTNYQNA